MYANALLSFNTTSYICKTFLYLKTELIGTVNIWRYHISIAQYNGIFNNKHIDALKEKVFIFYVNTSEGDMSKILNQSLYEAHNKTNRIS